MSLIVERFNKNRRHGYLVKDETGRVLAEDLYGITTVLGQVIAKPELIPWSAREAGKGIGAQIKEALLDPHPEDHDWINGLMKVANAAIEDGYQFAERIRDKAAGRGSDLHGACEQIGKARMFGVTPDLSNLAHTHNLSDKDRPLLDAYVGWLSENVEKVVSVERMVACVHCGYGATLDLEVALKTGESYIVDIKTGKGVYPDMWLQLAGQSHGCLAVECPSAACLDGRTPLMTDSLGVLWLNEKAKDGCELVPSPCDPNILEEALAGMMALWRWRQSLPKNGKR